jgi:hypothetical protein
MFHRVPMPMVLGAVAVLLAVSVAWAQQNASPRAGASPRSRALLLVLEKIFVKDSETIRAVDPSSWKPESLGRSWHVKRSGDAATKFDVTYSARGEALCVWRVDIASGQVLPRACQLDLPETPPA